MRSATVVCRTSSVVYLSAGEHGALALHDPNVPTCPFSIIVGCAVKALELSPGDRVQVGEGFIVSGHDRFAIRTPAVGAARSGRPPLAALRELARFVPKLAQRARELDPVLRPLEAWAAGKVNATWTVERVLGWGAGLTPSGDDALVGFLAAHALTRDGPRLRDLGELRSEISCQAPGRTTFVSAALLAHATAGRFSEPIEALGGAHSAHALAHSARRLARVGATSGLDTLAGIWLAARTSKGSVASVDTLSHVARRGFAPKLRCPEEVTAL